MKKLFTLVLAIAILSVAAMPSFAQGRGCRSRNSYGNSGRDSRVYNERSYYDYGNRNRSFWDKHRDKLTVAGGSVGGALLGAIIGGKKGAAIGALAGGGGSALYTYKIRNKNRPYWR